jgi:hypothetical protein
MSADFNRIKLLEFQQPLRCCNITAVAYGLSSLGYPTTVDDIFYQIRLPIGSVLDDGMTLSETYDACARYIDVVDLPLVVKVEHFDKPAMTLNAFIQEVEAGVEAESNIHILNFNTRIAHENPNLEGGHFALLADYDPKTQELTVADTNPKRYNRYWKCPVALMYQACVDKDSSSDRSRGMMVLEQTESRLG